MKLKESISEETKVVYISVVFFAASLVMSYFYPWFSDGVAHMTYADFILNNFAFPYAEYTLNAGKAFVTPPLFHIFLAISKGLFGFYGVVSSFMAAFSIYMTYKLVDLWYDERTAFLSAVSLALFPFFFMWSARVYIGTTVTAGFLVTFYYYFKYLKKKERRFLYLCFIFGGLVTSVKTYGPLALALVGLHMLWNNKESLENVIGLIREVFQPALIALLISLPWPIRNLLKTGSPFPKVTGVPYTGSSEQVVTGIWLFVPNASELVHFSSRIAGVMFPSILEGLKNIHPVLYFSWFLLPLLLLSLVSYGALDEKDNIFIWMWLGSLGCLYLVMRYLSGGGTSFKFRHFITISPVIALFMARSYQKMPTEVKWKKVFYWGLALALLIQMLASAAIFKDSMSASYEPMGEWVDENVPEEDIIYTVHGRQVISYTEKDFKIVGKSYKPGYINPDKEFADELSAKADWAIVINQSYSREEVERLEELRDRGVLELVKEIDATKERFYGEIGKKWRIYKVDKETS